MAGRECYHCKQWIEEGEAHDCWTTTEAALTRDLSEDLQDAWERLRETAASFGEQRIYASHKSIMFVAQVLLLLRAPEEELPRSLRVPGPPARRAPQVRRVDRASASKLAHLFRIGHRDEVEAPITGWLQEAYDLSGAVPSKARPARAKPKRRAVTAKKAKRARKTVAGKSKRR